MFLLLNINALLIGLILISYDPSALLTQSWRMRGRKGWREPFRKKPSGLTLERLCCNLLKQVFVDLGLKKIETKQFIHYVTLASIMSHQLELGDYKVKMQILFSLRMVNSTHNMVYGAFSSTATEELLLCTYDSNICNRCLKRYVNIREFFSKYFFNCI